MEKGSSRRRTGQKELQANWKVNTYLEFCLTVIKQFVKGFLQFLIVNNAVAVLVSCRLGSVNHEHR